MFSKVTELLLFKKVIRVGIFCLLPLPAKIGLRCAVDSNLSSEKYFNIQNYIWLSFSTSNAKWMLVCSLKNVKYCNYITDKIA